MRTVDHRDVKISSLLLPADWLKIVEEPEVAERAESIDKLGMIHEPVVRSPSMKLIAGRRRVASLVRLGREVATVKLVECTDEEALEIEYQENLQRRRYTDEEERALRAKRIAELKALEARETKGPAPRHPPAERSKPGRTKSSHGKAREKVAKERGVKPGSIRQQEYRERKRAAETVPTPEAELRQLAAPVKTLGFELDQAYIAGVSAVQVLMREAGARLRQAQASLTQLRNGELGYPEARLDRLREALKSLTAEIAAAVPTSLCPFCKGLPGVQEDCQACMGAGWITAGQMAGVPPELLREDEPMVMVQGVMHYASEYMGEDDGALELEDEDEDEEDVWPAR